MTEALRVYGLSSSASPSRRFDGRITCPRSHATLGLPKPSSVRANHLLSKPFSVRSDHLLSKPFNVRPEHLHSNTFSIRPDHLRPKPFSVKTDHLLTQHYCDDKRYTLLRGSRRQGTTPVFRVQVTTLPAMVFET